MKFSNLRISATKIVEGYAFTASIASGKGKG